MALSQFIPDVRIGYLYTYWGPLTFVIIVTMIREGRLLQLCILPQYVYVQATCKWLKTFNFN